MPRSGIHHCFLRAAEPASGNLQYASAGHNYPILVRANGKVELLRGGNLVMGLFSTVEYEAQTLRSGTGRSAGPV